MLIKLEILLVSFAMLIIVDWTSSAPKTWPYMKTYDIWETSKSDNGFKDSKKNVNYNNLVDTQRNHSFTRGSGRKAKGELLTLSLFDKAHYFDFGSF